MGAGILRGVPDKYTQASGVTGRKGCACSGERQVSGEPLKVCHCGLQGRLLSSAGEWVMC